MEDEDEDEDEEDSDAVLEGMDDEDDEEEEEEGAVSNPSIKLFVICGGCNNGVGFCGGCFLRCLANALELELFQ
tara:strand:+ start:419 stop:640 length:222 start_codon:yes stop_codon:yes gene_type:complete